MSPNISTIIIREIEEMEENLCLSLTSAMNASYELHTLNILFPWNVLPVPISYQAWSARKLAWIVWCERKIKLLSSSLKPITLLKELSWLYLCNFIKIPTRSPVTELKITRHLTNPLTHKLGVCFVQMLTVNENLTHGNWMSISGALL